MFECGPLGSEEQAGRGIYSGVLLEENIKEMRSTVTPLTNTQRSRAE